MTSAALISLRETLETSLIVGLMLTVLSRMDRAREQKWVWLGVGSGVAWSVAAAILFQMYADSLTRETRKLYEGVIMLVAAGLLVWTILWMMRMGKATRASIEHDLVTYAEHDHFLGIFLLSFTTTAREGTEMVLFLHAAFLSARSTIHHAVSALAGVTGAILLALLLFRGSRIFSLRSFFLSTSILLLFVATGLTVEGGRAILRYWNL